MTTPQQVSRDSLPNYQYLTPTVPEMMALGIHSPIILGEQLIINDRLRPDRYVVKGISGLRSPDIRDNREPRPSDHGEIPYDSFYSGETLTFNGTMEAGNIAEIGRLEQDLVAALGTLVEFPVRFNWWDQHDGFFDPQSTVYWGLLSGQPLSISGNGRAVTSGGGATLSYHNLRGGFVDEIVTAQVSVTPIGVANDIGVVACCTSDTSFLKAVVSWDGSSTWTLNLQVEQMLGPSSLATASIAAPTQQTHWWVTLQSLSDTVTASVYDVDPRVDPTATPIATCSTTLLGEMAQQFGYGRSGYCGLVCTSTASWSFLDWRVDSLWPCDFTLYGRQASAGPALAHVAYKSQNRYTRDFQFSIRCSDPRIYCPTRISVSVPLSTASQVGLGRIYPRVYPLAYIVPLSEPSGEIISQMSQTLEAEVINRGKWISKPVVVIAGGITNPVLTNLTTGESLALTGTIAQGDSVTIDCDQRTLTNSAGVSVFSMFDPSSSFLRLVPGGNPMRFSGSQKVGSPTATILYQSTWI